MKTTDNSANEINAPDEKLSQNDSVHNSAAKENKFAKFMDKKSVGIVISILQCVLYICVIVFVSYYLATYIIGVANDVFAFNKEPVEYTITIDENSTVSSIANDLAKNNIIDYPSVFKLYSKLRKDNGVFLLGSFTVNASMDYDAIRSTLKYKKSDVSDIRLTIPEGYTVDQIIDLLVENNIGTRQRYVEVINNYDFKFDFLPAMETLNPDRDYRLEGYLFPDTYDFNPTESEETVISKFLRNFKNKFELQYYDKAQKLGMSVDEVIILASIVEKEAKFDSDYEQISSVFHNRLNHSDKFPRLESCATINYFLEEHATVVTDEMTAIENPYNTYLHDGLTPGPICNPGAEAIAYAFYPDTKSKYYYFVSSNDGETLYAATFAEHQKNIAIANAANEAAKKGGK